MEYMESLEWLRLRISGIEIQGDGFMAQVILHTISRSPWKFQIENVRVELVKSLGESFTESRVEILH